MKYFISASALTLSLLCMPATALAATSDLGVPAVASAHDVTDQAAASSFDKAYLKKTCRYVITDMKTINERLEDGIGVLSAFYLLSDSYGYMLNAGVPPKIVFKKKYKARIITLSDFAEKAGDEYQDDPIDALARYAVIRKQTRILFKGINTAIGTDFKVPKL